MKINVDYIARVEGEGSVNLDIKDGILKDLKLNIWEPRDFEGFFLREV
jgi:coenzyme F420-reducing hydrogenase alpha subunit